MTSGSPSSCSNSAKRDFIFSKAGHDMGGGLVTPTSWSAGYLDCGCCLCRPGRRHYEMKNRQGNARSVLLPVAGEGRYWALAASALGASSAFLRPPQLYFFWNFSTRPVVSTNFILPVKKG